jgi:hypothetical protein
MRRGHQAGNAFTLHKPVQQFSDRTSGGIDRRHGAAEPVRHAGYVYAAPSGISFWRRTTQFARRLDAFDIYENVDCGVDRERDDIWHVNCPFR